jgi:hypothetical protein
MSGWEIIRSEKPWNTQSAAVDANDAIDDCGDLAVYDMQNQDLINMHKSYCKYHGITKKRAICKVVEVSMTTTFASITGGRIYGLSPSKKIRFGDTHNG